MTRVVYCENCLNYLKSCGYKIFKGSVIDSDEVIDNCLKCEFCINENYEDIELIECYEEV